jgi:hypothetical protein
MRIAKNVLFSTLLLAFMPAIGSAQDKPIHFNIGGGPTFVSGDLGDRFSMGWGPAIGVTFDTSEKIGFQFEYAYRWFALKDEADAAIGLLDANHTTHELSGNIIMNLTQPDSPVRFYIAAGPGMFYRSVEITRYAGTGVVCDPWYYVCGTYPIEAVLGSRGGWDFGFNIGGGVGFGIGETAEFFVESRFHYVLGPEFTPETSVPAAENRSGSTNGTYYPLTFGFRF